MGDAARDVGKIVQPVPEHFPAFLLDAAIGLRVIEMIDRVAMARAPEDARLFRTHDLPYRAAETFALRLVQYGKLVQVSQARCAHQDHRRPVVLADIYAARLRAF